MKPLSKISLTEEQKDVFTDGLMKSFHNEFGIALELMHDMFSGEVVAMRNGGKKLTLRMTSFVLAYIAGFCAYGAAVSMNINGHTYKGEE